MSPILHPWIALLYVIETAAWLYLLGGFKRPSLLGVLALLNVVQFLCWGEAFWFSPDKIPAWYWYSFWSLNFAMHVVVFVMVLRYIPRCLRSKRPIAQSFQATASLVMITLVGTVLLLRYWRVVEPDASRLLSVEQACQLWMCGVLWLVTLCGSVLGEYGIDHDVLTGLMTLYSVGLITSSLRIYMPMTREELWFSDLAVQLIVVLWWVKKLRATNVQM